MAITNDDFDRLRHELDVKIATVTVEQVNAATAISAYGERINGIELRVDALANEMDRRFDGVANDIERLHAQMDRRFDAVNDRFKNIDNRLDRLDGKLETQIDRLDRKLDTRFGWQTVIMVALGLIAIFNNVIQGALGL